MSRIHLILAAACLVFLATPSCAADYSLLPRGTREIGLSGIAYVTHDSPEDIFGVVTFRGGYYVAKNHQVGVDATLFAYSRIQDAYLSGFYRYVFAGHERRLCPFVGAAAGANVSHFEYIPTGRSLLISGEAGVRYRMTRAFSFDVTYDLMYRRNGSFGLTGRTTSVLKFGFARIF